MSAKVRAFSVLSFVSFFSVALADVELDLSQRNSSPNSIEELVVGRDKILGAFRNTGPDSVSIVMPSNSIGRDAYTVRLVYADKTIVMLRRATTGNMTGGDGVPHLFSLAPGEIYIFEIELNPLLWDLDVPEGEAKVVVDYSVPPEAVRQFSIPRWETQSGKVFEGRKATPLTISSNSLSVVVRSGEAAAGSSQPRYTPPPPPPPKPVDE